MAFYTDYEEIVSYAGSVLKTKSKVANVLANHLATYGGFTLIGLADESASSSASNCAELTKMGFNFKIYNTSSASSSLGTMTIYISNDFGQGDTYTCSFDYVSTTYVLVKSRFYNTKDGMVAHGLAIISAQDFEDNLNTKYLFVLANSRAGTSASFIAASDGSLTNNTISGLVNLSALSGYQSMSRITAGGRYVANFVFSSVNYLYSGIIKMNNRYFVTFVNTDSGRLTFELNP